LPVSGDAARIMDSDDGARSSHLLRHSRLISAHVVKPHFSHWIVQTARRQLRTFDCLPEKTAAKHRGVWRWLNTKTEFSSTGYLRRGCFVFQAQLLVRNVQHCLG